MGAIAAAAILHKEKEIIATFRGAGATSPARGKTAAALGVHEGVAFRKLCRRRVLRDAENGGHYLDEPSWEALRALRQRLALTLLGVAVALAVIALVLARRI
jgi:hypothetical protein